MQFDKIQGFGKEGVEVAMKSMTALGQGVQAAATETADYAKRSFEQGTQAAQSLATAKSLDVAMQIQGEYVRSAYEGLVGQAAKMNEIVVNTAKAVYAPVEGFVAKPVAA